MIKNKRLLGFSFTFVVQQRLKRVRITTERNPYQARLKPGLEMTTFFWKKTFSGFIFFVFLN